MLGVCNSAVRQRLISNQINNVNQATVSFPAGPAASSSRIRNGRRGRESKKKKSKLEFETVVIIYRLKVCEKWEGIFP